MNPLTALEQVLWSAADSPWALPVLFGAVLADSFVVVLPGEILVTALGALAQHGESPLLWSVIAVAGTAAALGDLACYGIGRHFHPHRWRIFRHPRLQHGLAWAHRQITTRTAMAVFTARFIPFARLVVNLSAGAARVPLRSYVPVVVVSAFLWAGYQAAVGAIVAVIMPGGTITAIAASIGVALILEWGGDRILRHVGPGRPSASRDEQTRHLPPRRLSNDPPSPR